LAATVFFEKESQIIFGHRRQTKPIASEQSLSLSLAVEDNHFFLNDSVRQTNLGHATHNNSANNTSIDGQRKGRN
jgi:hypothetical protein